MERGPGKLNAMWAEREGQRKETGKKGGSRVYWAEAVWKQRGGKEGSGKGSMVHLPQLLLTVCPAAPRRRDLPSPFCVGNVCLSEKTKGCRNRAVRLRSGPLSMAPVPQPRYKPQRATTKGQ